MGDLVNLRRARKARAKAQAAETAAANRVQHGRGRQAKADDAAEAARRVQAERRLDQGRLDDTPHE